VAQPKDEFRALEEELKQHVQRLKSKPPSSIEALANEFSGTGLEFTRELLGLVTSLRDWTYEQLSEMQQTIAELDPGQSTLLPEDAEKLVAFVRGAKLLIQRLIESGPTAEVAATLRELGSLAEECETIISDATLEEAEEDDEGESEGIERVDGGVPS
jgi:hypothetical protein